MSGPTSLLSSACSASPRLEAVELLDEDYQLIYEKGALVFRMLHRRLGDDAFFGLIRRWLEEYRGDFSTGDDFIRIASSFAEVRHEGTSCPGRSAPSWSSG